MSEIDDVLQKFNDSNSPSLKDVFYKYIFYWKFFLVSFIFFSIVGFVYVRYTHPVYTSFAKIKILDRKDGGLELPSSKNFLVQSNINIENEMEVLSSSPVLKKVVNDLALNVKFYSQGDVMTNQLFKFPFEFEHVYDPSSYFKSKLSYEISFDENEIEIFDEINKISYKFNSISTFNEDHDLPFNISWDIKEIKSDINNSYSLVFLPVEKAVSDLKESLNLANVKKKSDIIYLSVNSINVELSQHILNSIIKVFNDDGVQDRQLVFKRTVDFVNERFVTLSVELDSIENKKQDYKNVNNLVDIKANSLLSLELNSKSDQDLFYAENQIALTKILASSIDVKKIDLLPIIGVDNPDLNILLNDYNSLVLKYQNLNFSAGKNNPSSKTLFMSISESRKNILASVNGYLEKLIKIKEQYLANNQLLSNNISNIPEKQKILRGIERSQKIKESLYLFLLQKREEAEVNFAITEPTVKVVEYATSLDKPISPNKKLIFVLIIFLSLFFPIMFVLIYNNWNTKIYTKFDIDKLKLGGPVIAEIPVIEDEKTLFSNPNSRSVLAEAFRMLSSNIKYMISSESSQVLLISSTIKGEGKTFTAINASLALASLDKKVLLIGCDLRNPQLHKYVNCDKSNSGLVNFLVDKNHDWKKDLISYFDMMPNHNILISGALPPNPVQLLSNGNLELLIKQAKKEYDYIILDTAPTLLVTDTITIGNIADAVIYVTRANLTEIEVLNFPKELISSGKISNVGFVLNGLGAKNHYGYSYGYSYGYGYGYKYSYNYGYGYGYGEDKS